jgi:Zn-dependent protease
MDGNLSQILMILTALAIAIPIHEFAHARSAVSYGDDTPRRQGRLSIAPWDHFDPVGALMCAISSITGFGLGWGKPVQVNPAAFRHPRWDMVKCAAWGPGSNLLLAVGFALPLRYGWLSYGDPLLEFCGICLIVNVGLMFFNLIPIYPLDGSKILSGFLPRDLAGQYDRFMMVWGMPLMFLLIFSPQVLGGFSPLSFLIRTPSSRLIALLLGMPS